jgi:nucleotide-binding universal stress UspA family protein
VVKLFVHIHKILHFRGLIVVAGVSHKLSNSLEGALAGGGDPATSPLYVFGPFLRLIVAGGVAAVTFGPTIWLVVFTIAVVSAMYRLVMIWVTDGSGGSGLSEEEFGPWAVKVNAGITFVEYTLTFLVSMAAMVTFVADRVPELNEAIFGVQYRTWLAVTLSLLIGWLVNRGPKVAARAFGPATAGVLLLLWAMVFATIAQDGVRLPGFNLQAFNSEYLEFTFGGYVRILAVMTGIEVFANLVAAYDGPPATQSRRAFGSLLIIMGTASVTMLIVGPAILALSDPLGEEVSVFTQTMDALLPTPLAYMGSVVGILVLMSASAASAQGLQNLALGLSERNYVPAFIGQRNRFGVADKPVWIEVGLVLFFFLLLGTEEETYLAIYAAGVFILLSMTGWAATKRLFRQARAQFSIQTSALIAGTAIAAFLTTAATVLIFGERFFEGAWTYLVFIPILYAVFSYFRNTLGVPSPVVDQLGEIEGALLGGFGFGQSLSGGPEPAIAATTVNPLPLTRHAEPARVAAWCEQQATFERLLVPLDGSIFAEMALPLAEHLTRSYRARLILVTAVPDKLGYLRETAERLRGRGLDVDYALGEGNVVDATRNLVEQAGIDLVVTSTRGGSGARHWLTGGVASRIAQSVTKPVLLVQSDGPSDGEPPNLDRLLVGLDGSEKAEMVMPYAMALSDTFASEILLLSVPEVPAPEKFGVVVDWVEARRIEAEIQSWKYLDSIVAAVHDQCPSVRPIVSGSRPASAIVDVSEAEGVDMIMMVTHGRGGLHRLWMGSVTERVVQQTSLPVFLLPVHDGAMTDGRLSEEEPSAVRIEA